MSRYHTILPKSRALEYVEITSAEIPSNATVYQLSSIPSTVDLTKEYIEVSSHYYRIFPKEPSVFNSTTSPSGLMMGEVAINITEGYEALFAHKYSTDTSNTTAQGLSMYKPVTNSITLNTDSQYATTAQSVNNFTVPNYIEYNTATVSLTMTENTVYRCLTAVTSLTLNVANMITGPKTRESVIYFTTGTSVSFSMTGTDSSTIVFGNTTLTASTDYIISVKDKTVIISTVEEINDATFYIKTKVGASNPVTVGGTSANASTNTSITFIQGTNVTLTTDAGNSTVTIAATDTTYSDFVGCDAVTAGSAGLVPAPAAGDESSFLTGDGTWQAVGTLDTTATTAQSTSASESFGSSIILHQISKTGNYNDLLNTPTIPVIEANPTVPSGTTPTGLSGLKIDSTYYTISQTAMTNSEIDTIVNSTWV